MGSLLTLCFIALAGTWVQARFGIALRISAPTVSECVLVGGVMLAGMLVSLVPAIRAYRLSLADGLSPRI